MRLEIDIPSIIYNDAKENRGYISVGKMEIAWRAIADGKPLEQESQIRPKGHWIQTNDYFTGAYESIDYVECSCCHADSLEEGNYCPNCGAEMSEVEE
jgi:hypothetical protein